MICRHPLRRIWGRAGFEARDASAESLCAQLALIRLNSPVSGVCGAASNSLTGAILGVHATRSGVPSWRTAVAPIAARLRELLRPAGVGCRFWSRLVAVAALPLLGVAPWFGTASAQTCPNSSGVVTASGISCSIPPASTVNRITGSSDAMITANGVRVSVPFGVGVTSQTGSLITFGVDPVAGASSIVSEFGGGGITVLLANGMSSRIDASDLNVTFGGGGNIMVEAQAGGQITLDDGTVIDILNSGGNQGLLATGTNSRIIANNITETATVGGGDFGVHAQSGGLIDLTNSVFNFNGTGGGETVVVAESHSTIVAQNSTFTATGGGGGDVAIKVDTGSNVSLTGGLVTMTSVGGGEIAVLTQAPGSTFSATDVPITLIGSGGDTAVKAANGGVVTLTGGSDSVVSTAGGEKGIWATGANSSITATGASISVPFSAGGFGVLADTAGTIALSVGSVSTGGDGSIGIRATGGGSSVTATGGVTVATTGASATGVDASAGGMVSLTGGAVTTSGGGAAGLSASAGTIAASGVGVATNGLAAPGGILQGGGLMTIGGGAVTTSGAGSFGFLFQGSGGIANALQVTGATVNSAADAFRVEGVTANIDLSGATVAAANGILMSTSGQAAASLTATSSSLTGAITTAVGGVSDVTLQGGTIWNMTGSSNVTSLANAETSTIVFSAPVGDPTQLASYKTLTAVNYTGMGGGIVLNTFLGNDSSPSDRVIIDGGAATGATRLDIRNTTGPGAETVANGIPVVQATDGATTTPGAFALANGELRAGAFTYDLFRGGVSGSASDWFLRSSFVAPPIPPEPPIPPIPPPLPPLPPLRSLCSPSIRRRTRCRPASRFRSSGRNSPPMGWCSRWPGNWGSASWARSTIGSATPTSRTVAPLRRRSRRQPCRPGSQGLRLRPARSSRPPSGGASSAKRSTTTIKPLPIPPPTAIWEASRVASIFCADL